MNSVVTLLFELPINQNGSKNLIITFSSSLADSTSDKLKVIENLHAGLFESIALHYVTFTAMVKLANKTRKLSEIWLVLRLDAT